MVSNPNLTEGKNTLRTIIYNIGAPIGHVPTAVYCTGGGGGWRALTALAPAAIYVALVFFLLHTTHRGRGGGHDYGRTIQIVREGEGY